jgi:predicted amidophosphoribosyltransferase
MQRCPVCDVDLPPGVASCPNYWCRRSDRGFDTVWAVAPHAGEVRRAILALKYRGDRRWATPLGRLLGGYLVDRAPSFDDVDLIVATPSVRSWHRPLDHVRAVLAAAAPLIGGLWPVDDPGHPVLVKRETTRSLTGTPSAAVRRLWAAGELRAVLAVDDRTRVADLRVLAVDDVFTDGSTLREVAGALRGAGAKAVSGLVLARAPLRDRGFP